MPPGSPALSFPEIPSRQPDEYRFQGGLGNGKIRDCESSAHGVSNDAGKHPVGALDVDAHGPIHRADLSRALERAEMAREGGEVAVGGDLDDCVGAHRSFQSSGRVEGEQTSVIHYRYSTAHPVGL